jgi:hypothetical protein
LAGSTIKRILLIVTLNEFHQGASFQPKSVESPTAANKGFEESRNMTVPNRQCRTERESGLRPRQKASPSAESSPALQPFMTRITQSTGRVLPFLAFVTIPFCILCLFTSLSDLRAYPGRDLRPKVAGARLLAAGLDPYDFNSPPPDGDYLKTNTLINFTPGLLLLYIPLSTLPYETQRTIYFSLDWLFAAAAFYILQRTFCQTRIEKYFCWIIYAVFLVCSYSFRLHLERGQYYVLLMFLTCCTAASIRSNRTNWLSCMPTALLLLLRPTYGLVLPAALLCFGARKWATRVSIITAFLFSVTLCFGGLERWVGFLHIVHQTKVDFLNEAVIGCGQEHYVLPAHRQIVDVIEGVNYHTGLSPHAISGTLSGLFRSRSLRICSVVSPQWVDGLNSVGMWLVLTLGLLISFVAQSRRASPNILIAYMLLWPMSFELFIPERYLYAAVLEVVPLILVLSETGVGAVQAHTSAKFRALASILALGIIAPAAYQLARNTRVAAFAISAFILFLLPICMIGYCICCIATSRTGVCAKGKESDRATA